MKLCKDCRYYVANRSDKGLSTVECNHHDNVQPDYINGGTKHYYLSASALRTGSTLCGSEGKWWEPA